MNDLAACLLLVHAAAQQGLQVLHDAHCVEARASFLGAHLQETNGTARVALDLQLTALSTCDKHTKVLVDASAEDALVDGDDGLEVCVLWVSMTGAERRTSRCYGGGQPARVEWDLTAALKQRYRLVAWPARGAWPGAFAGASHTLSFEADLGAAAFPPPHLLFTGHEHGATLAGRERRACDGSPLHLYAGTQHRDTDENWYHFTFGMLLPLAARLSERDDACAAVGRRPPPTVLYVRRCGFRRALIEAGDESASFEVPSNYESRRRRHSSMYAQLARTTFGWSTSPASRRPKTFRSKCCRAWTTGATRPTLCWSSWRAASGAAPGCSSALLGRRRAPRACSRRGPRGRAGGRSPSRILRRSPRPTAQPERARLRAWRRTRRA